MHYVLRVWLSATDNNVETGPATSRTKVPLEFLIVSETELLSFIVLQEAELCVKLEKIQEDLKKHKIILHEQVGRLSPSQEAPPYDDIRGRIDQVLKAVEAGQSGSRGVLGDFTKIHHKLVANRVDRRQIEKVFRKIVLPLEDLAPVELSARGEFSECADTLRELRTGLEEDAGPGAKNLPLLPQRLQAVVRSEEQFDQVMKKLNNVIQVMKQEVKYSHLLESIVAMEREQREIQRIEDQRFRKFYDELFNPVPPEKK